VADRLHASGQTKRARSWKTVRPEALVPAEREVATGKLLGRQATERQSESKDRRDERDGRRPPRRRPTGRALAVAGTALAVVVAGSGIALALTRDNNPAQPTAARSPSGGPAGTPAGGPSTTSQPGTGPTTGAGSGVRVYRGTVTVTWGPSTSSNTSVVQVLCTPSGTCVTGLTNREPNSVTIPLGSGAPGTYAFAFPRKADPCTTRFPFDAVKGSVVLTETSLSYRSTSPGWNLKCSATHYTRNAPMTVSYKGTLQP
jgi:hypothetical protein